jgi:hypothetical protein
MGTPDATRGRAKATAAGIHGGLPRAPRTLAEIQRQDTDAELHARSCSPLDGGRGAQLLRKHIMRRDHASLERYPGVALDCR